MAPEQKYSIDVGDRVFFYQRFKKIKTSPRNFRGTRGQLFKGVVRSVDESGHAEIIALPDAAKGFGVKTLPLWRLTPLELFQEKGPEHYHDEG